MSSKENAFLNQGSENKRKKDHSVPYFHYNGRVVDGGGLEGVYGVRWLGGPILGERGREKKRRKSRVKQINSSGRPNKVFDEYWNQR